MLAIKRSVKFMKIIAASAVAFIVLLEIALRVVGLGAPVLFSGDPAFGGFPQPNQRLFRFFVHIDINELGMRSAPVSPVKAHDEFRILMVGDSVPFGTTYVDQKDIFPVKIAASLNRAGGRPVTVMNASSPGWAPANELGFIEARGLYDADWVVMTYNTKDLTQPFAAYSDSPLSPSRNPSSAISELWFRYLAPKILRSAPLVDPGSVTPEGRPSEAAEQRVLDTIEATRQWVTDHGARFAIIYVPSVMPDVRRYQADWDQALSHLKSWATRTGVPLLDLSAALDGKPVAAEYFDGIHLRPAGDELVADAFINWFPSARKPGATP